MAINPNTDFSAGAVLTASQQNRFPRGIMVYTTNTTTGTFTAEAIQITGSSFTAVANRYYRVTYFEPNLNNASDSNTSMQIRLTNLAGASQGAGYTFTRAGSFSATGLLIVYTTLSAGATTLVATAQSTVGTTTATRSTTYKAFLSVEDVGPA